MGKLMGKAVWLGLAAGAAVLVYALRRSAKTGRDIGTVLSNLPEEFKESGEELQQHVEEALSAGRKAAAEREAEIDRQLNEEEQDYVTPVKDYIV